MRVCVREREREKERREYAWICICGGRGSQVSVLEFFKEEQMHSVSIVVILHARYGGTKDLPIVAQADGLALGLAEGDLLGWSLGRALSRSLGEADFEGAIDGPELGLAEGDPLARSLGIDETDGPAVGFSESDLLGLSLGEADMDGTPDGEVENVGDKLGLNTSHSSMFTKLNLLQSMGPVKKGLSTA